MSHTNPDRGCGRPVARRTRTFRPNYLSFAGTYQCNLTCPHCCVPIEWPDRLDIDVAVRFLEQAHDFGIEWLGFTGGEPFLYPEFLVAVTKRAVALGMKFDRIVTNGVWHSDLGELRRTFGQLHRAGFTGKIGLSVDKFHGKHTSDLADFCRTARKVFGRDNIVSLNWASRDEHVGLEPIQALAKELDAVVEWSPILGRYLLVSIDMTMTLNFNHLAPVERAEKLDGGWDGQWFEEDYCEGPGQALIVTPRGEVKPCCGFASDLDQLTIGNIHVDSVTQVVARARKHPYVGKLFREGLTSFRDEILARDPGALPGETSNHCFFCWYVLTKNLVELPSGFPGTAPKGRVSLTLAGDGPSPPAFRPGESSSRILMAFDGKKVFLRRELSSEMPLTKGQVYLIEINGSRTVESLPDPMTWDDYQAWINRLRSKGHTFKTHKLSPCQK